MIEHISSIAGSFVFSRSGKYLIHPVSLINLFPFLLSLCRKTALLLKYKIASVPEDLAMNRIRYVDVKLDAL